MLMNWTLIFSGISAASTCLIVIQIFVTHRQSKKLHEEQRRQRTVDMMMSWSASLKRATSTAEKIVERFSKEQCRNLYLEKPFKVNGEIKQMLCSICGMAETEECSVCKKNTSDLYEISGKQLLELRWHIISYLNTLETVLVAWQQGTVDKKIVEHEFSYLYDDEKGWDVLSHFRAAAGGDKAYPVISEFCETLKENQKNQNKIKSKKEL